MADKCFKLHPLQMTVPAARRRQVHVDPDEQVAAICTDPMYQPVVKLRRLKMRPVPRSGSVSLADDQQAAMDTIDDNCDEAGDQATGMDGDESAARVVDADGPLENAYLSEEASEQWRSTPNAPQITSPTIDADDQPMLTESAGEMLDEHGGCPTPMEIPEGRDHRLEDGPPEDDVQDDDDARSDMSVITVISRRQPIASTGIIKPCADNTVNDSGAAQRIRAARQMMANRVAALFDSYDHVVKDRDDLRAKAERQSHEIARLKGVINTILYRDNHQSYETQQMHTELLVQHRKMITDLESKFKMDMERSQAEHRHQMQMLLRRCEPTHQGAADER